ncbi:MAG: RpoL/Rpb11 RNA polymerase subunit family protein [Candidatus Aenigmarchaeota archaeon]|nr:RpoL/Rpb11 RNA polymerase subunit family protein [Candidatus Aenigmarchaeota archaeon]
MVIEFKGESFSFVNLIEEELWKSKNIDEAACIKEHPYMVEPKLYIKMKAKKSPEVDLKKAIKRIQAQLNELKKKFTKALKD